VHVTQQSKDKNSSVYNYVGLRIFDERAVFDQVFMSVVDIGSKIGDLENVSATLFTKSHVNALDAEVACDGHCSIDVVAEALEKLGCLGLHHVRGLLIASVQSQVNEFLWIIIQLLSLCFCSFDKVESNIKHEVWQKSEENFFEIVILGSKTQILKCFNYKIADSFLVK
jgi:hypothetical protein